MHKVLVQGVMTGQLGATLVVCYGFGTSLHAMVVVVLKVAHDALCLVLFMPFLVLFRYYCKPACPVMPVSSILCPCAGVEHSRQTKVFGLSTP